MSGPAESPPGKIITFYSYKGGTGRSMALANLAWILASRGKRVLMLDWDLEAPGLQRYFYPFLLDRTLRSTDGLIDFFRDFVLEAATARDDASPEWHVPYADLTDYAIGIEWKHFGGGRLDLVPAGRQGASYSTRVNSFDWQGFYDRLGGGPFLEEVKRGLRQAYDYVLIDSRTGVSDTAGICTVQMPDALVVCFTLNNQSIDGAAAVAESVMRQRPDITVLPVPTRVEPGEDERRKRRLEYARLRFRDFPNLPGLEPARRDEYWARAPFYYIPVYAYEETLSPFVDVPGASLTVLQPAEYLAQWVTGDPTMTLAPDSVQERDRVLAQYREQVQPEPDEEMERVRAAEAFIAAAPEAEREGYRRILTRLVVPARPGTGEHPRRARVVLADLDSTAAALAQRLASAGVVETDPEPGETAIRLSGEWMAAGWPRLRAWVEAEREFLLWLHALQPSVAAWKRDRAAPGVTLRELRLAEAERWLSIRRADLLGVERAFIEASAAEEERELAHAAARVAAEWTEEEAAAARTVLPRLVRVPAEGHAPLADDRRCAVAVDELLAAAPRPVQALLDQRVLVRETDAGGGPALARLARPSLVDGWTLLRDWVKADRAFLRWQDQLRGAEARWRASRFDDALLLDGAALDGAEAWRARLGELPSFLRLYLDASEERRARGLAQRGERARALLTAAELQAVAPVLAQAAAAGGVAEIASHTSLSPVAENALRVLEGEGVAVVARDAAGAATAVRVLTPALYAEAPASPAAPRSSGTVARTVGSSTTVGEVATGSSGAFPLRTTGRVNAPAARRRPRRGSALMAAGVGTALVAVLAAVLVTPLSLSRARERPAQLTLDGSLAQQAGDFEAADSLFRRAIHGDSAYLPAYLALADLQVERGQFDDARVVLTRADARSPGSASLALRRGIVSYRTGELAAASRFLTDVIRADSGGAVALGYRALAYHRRELPDSAVADARAALRRDSLVASDLLAREEGGTTLLAAAWGGPSSLSTPRDSAGPDEPAPPNGRNVYLHHARDADAGFMALLGQRLDAAGFCVPGPSERRPQRLRDVEVRYYFEQDADAAREVVRILAAALEARGSPTAVELDRMTDTSARGGLIEVWLPAREYTEPLEATVRSGPSRACSPAAG